LPGFPDFGQFVGVHRDLLLGGFLLS
jgi:hypothetical protein